MTRIEKKFQRIMSNPIDIKWNELRTVLERFGLVCEPPSDGSHWTIYDERSDVIQTVPVHNNRVKKVYVKRLLRLIQEIQGEE